jgi:hypothetical protein
MKMTKGAKWGIVLAAGAATVAFLWHEHAAQAAPGVGADSSSKATTPKSVSKPHARAAKTAATAAVDNVSPAAADEPFTQLQLDSAAALGYGNSSSQDSAAGDDPPSRALNEDLQYLGIGS